VAGHGTAFRHDSCRRAHTAARRGGGRRRRAAGRAAMRVGLRSLALLRRASRECGRRPRAARPGKTAARAENLRRLACRPSTPVDARPQHVRVSPHTQHEAPAGPEKGCRWRTPRTLPHTRRSSPTRSRASPGRRSQRREGERIEKHRPSGLSFGRGARASERYGQAGRRRRPAAAVAAACHSALASPAVPEGAEGSASL
jgi:hypothetical protein